MGTTVHTFTDDALGRDDAVGIARRIRSGELSAREATEAAITRVESVDPALNAIQFEAFAEARDAAKDADADLGPAPFAGVPSALKDNTDLAGWPTLHGTVSISPTPMRSTSAPARQFLAQGYTVVGKTKMPEFGLTASTEFVGREPTRNPWNTEYSAGASSGGAAALVAAGALPLAHANDGGGSIRIPASACGLVGLKPSRERTLDRPGVRSLPVNLIGEGVVTRTVRDTAHHLAGMERTYRNPELPAVGLVEGTGARRRIGLLTVSATGAPLDPEVVAVARSGADVLAGLGHEIVEIAPPVGMRFATDFTTYWGISAALMALTGALTYGWRFHPRRLEPFTTGIMSVWRRRAASTPGTIRRLRAVRATYDAVFDDLDAVLSPTVGTPTPELGYLSPEVEFEEFLARLTTYAAFTPFNNVGGGPGISVPHGRSASGLPGSLHLSAATGDERVLLELAYALEEAAPFPRIEAIA